MPRAGGCSLKAERGTKQRLRVLEHDGAGWWVPSCPPITTFTLRWPIRMELNRSLASVRALHVPGASLPGDLR